MTLAQTALLLLADARLPTGGHTQSGGLEPALLGGLAETDVAGFLRTRLDTAVRVDAATAVVVRRGAELEPVVAAWNARVPSEAVREASYTAARGYLRLGGRFGLSADLARRTNLPRPVAIGLLARLWQLDPADTARVVCHDEIQTVTAAALKLAPLDPLEPVGWVLSLDPLIDEVVAASRDLTDPEQIPAATAPLAELWQHAHPHHTRRLFRA